MNRLIMLASLIGALILLVPQTSWADRGPTAEERTRIEAQLQSLGFTNWVKIELDEDRPGYWEVDDARAADGRYYDLKLDPQTLEVRERKVD
jgi:hypothetical protein